MRKTVGNQDTWLVALGKTIRKRRTQLQISQQELAIDSDVHRTYVSDIERGSRNLTILTLNRIALALGTTAGALCLTANELAKEHNQVKNRARA
jgi:transcriptional regulator with XRE-family HTH domain